MHTESMDAERVALVTRCARVYCDLKGRNFFALQQPPTTNMRLHPEKMPSTFRDSMSEFYAQTVVVERAQDHIDDDDDDDDPHRMFMQMENLNFSDLSLLFKDHRFQVHKYILASRGLF